MSRGKSKEQLAAFKERIRVFLAAVQSGASDRSAAAEAGIGMSTLQSWRQGERPFDVLMRTRLMRARATRERRWLEWIEQAAQPTTRTNARGTVTTVPGDWRAAQFLLSTTNPEFAQRVKAEVTGSNGGPLQIEQDVEVRLQEPDADRIRKVMNLLNVAGAVPMLETSENGNGNGQH